MAQDQTPENDNEFYKRTVELLHEEIQKLKENNRDINERTIRTNDLVYRIAGINPETNEEQESLLDERLNKTISDSNLVNGIISDVYRGRFVSIKQAADKTVKFYFVNFNHRVKGQTDPTTVTLSEESFVLILEAMEFAIKQFGINRQEVIKRLTESGRLDFKHAITDL